MRGASPDAIHRDSAARIGGDREAAARAGVCRAATQARRAPGLPRGSARRPTPGAVGHLAVLRSIRSRDPQRDSD